MDSYQLFAGRAYVFNESTDIPDDLPEYAFVRNITKKLAIPFVLNSVKDLGGTEDYDVYKISSLGKDYILKTSFDCENKELNNEIYILKNNKSLVIHKHVDSGQIVIGENIKYLLYECEDFLTLEEFGVSNIIVNFSNFISSYLSFANLKCERTFSQFSEQLIEKVDPLKWTPFIYKQITSLYDPNHIKFIHDKVYEEYSSLYDEQKTSGHFLGDPRICPQNISTNELVYRFEHVGNSFKCDEILALCFLFLNFGFSKKMHKKLLKEYCNLKSISYKEAKKKYKYFIKIACCVFLFDSFYKFIIEESIFEASRPKNIFFINLIVSNCLDICSCLDCYEEIHEPIKKIITRPIIQDSEDYFDT